MLNRHRGHRDERRYSRPRRHPDFNGRFELKRKPYPQTQTHPNKADIFMKAGRLAAEYLVLIGQLPESALRPKSENRRSDELESRGIDYRINHRSDGFDDDWRKRRRRNEERRWMGRDWDSSGRRAEFSRGYRKNRRFGFRERRARNEDRADRGRFEGGVRDLDDRDEVMSYESGEVRDGEVENGGLLVLCRFENVTTRPRTLLPRRRRISGGGGSLSNGKESPIDHGIGLNVVASDKEVKIDIGGDVGGSCDVREDDDGLLKLYSFTKLPAKPRTSLGRRRLNIDGLFAAEETKTIELVFEVPGVIEGRDLMVGLTSDSHMNQTNTLGGKAYAGSSTSLLQNVEESAYQKDESIQCTALLGSFLQSVVNVQEEIKVVVEDKIQHTLYKVCDLNLMPEDDLVADYFRTQVPVFEPSSDQLPTSFGHMMGNILRSTSRYFGLSSDEVTAVLNFEDGSSTASNLCDSPKPKSEAMNSGLSYLSDTGDNGTFLAVSMFEDNNYPETRIEIPGTEVDDPEFVNDRPFLHSSTKMPRSLATVVD